MRCTACDADLDPTRTTCQTCGASARQCPSCGFDNLNAANFCGGCGKPLTEQDKVDAADDFGTPDAWPMPRVERRLLTIMCVDMVNSTALASRLDPEELREPMREFLDAISSEVAHFGGHLTKFLGDGALAYFGFPSAQEDAVERAVRTGLGIVQRVAKIRLDSSNSMQCRVGVATGIVIAGDVIGEGESREVAVVGNAPAITARLQSLAEPNQVIISERSRRLISGAFELIDLGERELKGIATPMQVWRACGESAATPRFDPTGSKKITPFVNRENELARLRDLWQRVCAGSGQSAIAKGEAGVGKSRVLHAFISSLKPKSYRTIFLQCSPLHANSAFWAIKQQLLQTASITSSDDAEQRLKKIEALAGAPGIERKTAVPLLANLLETDATLRYPSFGIDAAQQRRRTLEYLVRRAVKSASEHPLIICLEDAQWIDPSTRNFAKLLCKAVPTSRILFVITTRPTEAHNMEEFDTAHTMEIDALASKASGKLVALMDETRKLDETVRAGILARSEGVPLFIEELTSAILEGDLENWGNQRDELRQSKHAIPIPLHDILNARLDRLGLDKPLIKIAACIGRTFNIALLCAVSGVSTVNAAAQLNRITAANLLLPQAESTPSNWTFRHSLLRDAAYDSILLSERKSLHARIAEKLTSQFAAESNRQPEVVALHHHLAGEIALAAAAWHKAGRLAGVNSAHQEAIGHLHNALAALCDLPRNCERLQAEIRTWIDLGGQYIALHGNAASDVESAFQHAVDLATELADDSLQLEALQGLQTNFIVRGSLAEACTLGETRLRLADRSGDKASLVIASRPHGLCLMYLGDFENALLHLQRAAANFNPDSDNVRQRASASDPGVLAQCNLGWVRWFLGDYAQGDANIAAALSRSERLNHAHTEAFALSFACSLYQGMGKTQAVLDLSERLIALSERHEFVYWRTWAELLRAWAQATIGVPAKWAEAMERSITDYKNTRSRVVAPYFETLFGDALIHTGQYRLAVQRLNSAMELAQRHGILFYQPETMRLLGNCEMAGGNHDAARELRRQALALANEQNSRSFFIRVLSDIVEYEDPMRARELKSTIARLDDSTESNDLARARRLSRI